MLMMSLVVLSGLVVGLEVELLEEEAELVLDDVVLERFK